MIFSMIASIINDFTTSPTNEYRAVFMSNTRKAGDDNHDEVGEK